MKLSRAPRSSPLRRPGVAAAFWIRFGVLFRADDNPNTGQAEIALSIVTVES